MDLLFRFMLNFTQISLIYLRCYIVRSTTSCLKEANSLHIEITKLLQISPNHYNKNKNDKTFNLVKNLTGAGNALRPKSEIFRFPWESSRRFSGYTWKEKKIVKFLQKRGHNNFPDTIKYTPLSLCGRLPYCGNNPHHQ